MSKDNYNYGIDVLKIVATFMMIVMHILLRGGILESTKVGSINYYLTWTLEAIAFVSVNLYALITGYLNAKKEIKRTAFLDRWLQVFFYVAFFTGLFAIISPETISWKSIIKMFIPVLSNQYWYFTQYFFLFMLMPYLNKLMSTLTKKEFKSLCLTIIIILSVLPMMVLKDVFITMDGYSALWLISLYIIGGYISYYKEDFTFSKRKLWLVIIGATIITASFKFALDAYRGVQVNDVINTYLLRYTATPIVLSSIAMLILASNIKFKKGKKIIKFLGKTTFGIYLLHVNFYIWTHVFHNAFSFMAEWNPLLLTLGLLGSALSIFLAGVLFEFIRTKLFHLMRVDSFSGLCKNKIKCLLSRTKSV